MNNPDKAQLPPLPEPGDPDSKYDWLGRPYEYTAGDMRSYGYLCRKATSQGEDGCMWCGLVVTAESTHPSGPFGNLTECRNCGCRWNEQGERVRDGSPKKRAPLSTVPAAAPQGAWQWEPCAAPNFDDAAFTKWRELPSDGRYVYHRHHEDVGQWLRFPVPTEVMLAASSTPPAAAEGALTDLRARLDPVYQALKDNDCLGASLALERVLSWCQSAALSTAPAPEAVDADDLKLREQCFACGKPIKSAARAVWTRDPQRQFVGLDCFRKVAQAGAEGYQPDKGGPRLFKDKP